MAALYPNKYIRIKSRGDVIIKDKWYSFKRIVISYENVITDLIPRTFASAFDDVKDAFDRFQSAVEGSEYNKGYGAVEYLYKEFTYLKPDNEKFLKVLDSKIHLKNKSKVSNGFWLHLLSKFRIYKPKTVKIIKPLPFNADSQYLLPFENYLEPNNGAEVVAIISTGNAEWDKEMEKVVRYRTFF